MCIFADDIGYIHINFIRSQTQSHCRWSIESVSPSRSTIRHSRFTVNIKMYMKFLFLNRLTRNLLDTIVVTNYYDPAILHQNPIKSVGSEVIRQLHGFRRTRKFKIVRFFSKLTGDNNRRPIKCTPNFVKIVREIRKMAMTMFCTWRSGAVIYRRPASCMPPHRPATCLSLWLSLAKLRKV